MLDGSRRAWLARGLLLSGLGVVLLTLLVGLWRASHPQPRCLAGLFVTLFLPSLLGMLLTSGGLALGVARRWWAGCLTLGIAGFLSLIAAMGLVSLVVSRKHTVERRAADQRCSALRASLLRRQHPNGSFPPTLDELPEAERTLCSSQEDPVRYLGGVAGYLLAVPASSIDIDGALLFSGPQGQWGLVDHDTGQRLERAVRAGKRGSPQDLEGDGGRYAALLRRVLVGAASDAGGAAPPRPDGGIAAQLPDSPGLRDPDGGERHVDGSPGPPKP